jgi:hypothetical protein
MTEGFLGGSIKYVFTLICILFVCRLPIVMRISPEIYDVAFAATFSAIVTMLVFGRLISSTCYSSTTDIEARMRPNVMMRCCNLYPFLALSFAAFGVGGDFVFVDARRQLGKADDIEHVRIIRACAILSFIFHTIYHTVDAYIAKKRGRQQQQTITGQIQSANDPLEVARTIRKVLLAMLAASVIATLYVACWILESPMVYAVTMTMISEIVILYYGKLFDFSQTTTTTCR